jgi:hypothetical protein
MADTTATTDPKSAFDVVNAVSLSEQYVRATFNIISQILASGRKIPAKALATFNATASGLHAYEVGLFQAMKAAGIQVPDAPAWIPMFGFSQEFTEVDSSQVQMVINQACPAPSPSGATNGLGGAGSEALRIALEAGERFAKVLTEAKVVKTVIFIGGTWVALDQLSTLFGSKAEAARAQAAAEAAKNDNAVMHSYMLCLFGDPKSGTPPNKDSAICQKIIDGWQATKRQQAGGHDAIWYLGLAVILAGLTTGGVLLYRHFKRKKQGSLQPAPLRGMA